MKDDDKNKVIFNSTEGKSHLLDYFIDKISSNNNTDNRLNKVIDKADKMDLTYFKDSDGKYCICDVDWIGRFDTLEKLENYLDL